MQKPNLDNIWETAIRIPYNLNKLEHILTLRKKVIPTIILLENSAKIMWYCFNIHNKKNGLPIEYDGPQFHIRFENSQDIEENELIQILPEYCEMTQKANVNTMDGIDQHLLKNEDIANAWKIEGELCEWIVNSIRIHKDGVNIKKNLCQFFHYHVNILQPTAIIQMPDNIPINLTGVSTIIR